MTTPPKDWMPPFMKGHTIIDFTADSIYVILVLATDLNNKKYIFILHDGEPSVDKDTRIKNSIWYKLALLWKDESFSAEDIATIGARITEKTNNALVA